MRSCRVKLQMGRVDLEYSDKYSLGRVSDLILGRRQIKAAELVS